jgi:prophage regulatory protein
MADASQFPTRILRRKQVEHETGLSRSTIYLRISQRLWPKPVSLGARAVGWPATEIHALNAARIAGRSDDEIRVLVSALERDRITAAVPRSGIGEVHAE